MGPTTLVDEPEPGPFNGLECLKYADLRGTGSAGYLASVITAAPTVALVASSIRIRPPVIRLRV